ncbi:type VII secretion target [Amycolatopsis benzoatilytica]|uniref:type VII secretion target n=1 Tax=Amycolatopsis benzoatilytica TaxID=346045 RepID=UPI0003603E42|nr:type VII secretion target [Amycolatopsis benzoatilytica]
MAPRGYEIGSDLEAHARQLDGIADALKQAVDAANQVSMPTDAYGILCQPFRMMLDPVENYGVTALQNTVAAMDAQAQKVRDAAKAYHSYESEAAGSMKASD